jgi:hypothetical protein
MSAPERITVDKDEAKYLCSVKFYDPSDTTPSTEYIRADLAKPVVKPLVWVDYPYNGEPVLSMAITPLGTYFICDDKDDFSGNYLQFVSHDNAKWWQNVRSTRQTILEHIHDDDLRPMKASAQADFERRIRECLK